MQRRWLRLRAVRVFAPLVTLPLLRRIARAAEEEQPDGALAEWLPALHFRAADAASQPANRPLLV